MKKLRGLIVLLSVVMLALSCMLLASCGSVDTTSAATLVLNVETAIDADEVVVTASSGQVVKNGKSYTISFSNRNNHTITVWAKDYLTETLVVSAVDFKKSNSITRTIKLENKKLNAIKLNVIANSLYTIEKANQFDGEITKKGNAVTVLVPKLGEQNLYNFKISGNGLEQFELSVNSNEIVGGYYSKNIVLTEKDTRLIYIYNMELPSYFLTEKMKVLKPIVDSTKYENSSRINDFYIKLDNNDKVIIENNRDSNVSFVTKVDGATSKPYGTEVNASSGGQAEQLTKKLFVEINENPDLYLYSPFAGNNKKYYQVNLDYYYKPNENKPMRVLNIGNDGKLFFNVYNDDGENQMLEYTFTDQQLDDSFNNPIKIKRLSENLQIGILDAEYIVKDKKDKDIYYDISQKTSDGFVEVSKEDAENLKKVHSEKYYNGDLFIISSFCSPEIVYKFKFDKGVYDTEKFSFEVNGSIYFYESVADVYGNVAINSTHSINSVYKIVIKYSFEGGTSIQENKFLFENEYAFSEDGTTITFEGTVMFGGYGIVRAEHMRRYKYNDIMPESFKAIGINYTGVNDVTFIADGDNNNDVIMLTYGEALVKLTAKFKVRVMVYASGGLGSGELIAETTNLLTFEKYMEIARDADNAEGEEMLINAPVPMTVISQNLRMYGNNY